MPVFLDLLLVSCVARGRRSCPVSELSSIDGHTVSQLLIIGQTAFPTPARAILADSGRIVGKSEVIPRYASQLPANRRITHRGHIGP
jgi:hypothetical protein